MAFADIVSGLNLPEGASERYRKLEALGRMVDGRLYSDMKFAFDVESESGRRHIPLRERRPSTILNLAYEVTQDTCAELFGDEQFPIVHVLSNREKDEAATTELDLMFEVTGLQDAIVEAYEEGVIGSAGVVIHKSDNGLPYYEVLPGKYCQPVYRSHYSNELLALIVTYPITRRAAEERITGLSKQERNKGEETFWYRYVVGPVAIIDYVPLSDKDYARLGEKDEQGVVIEFKEDTKRNHGFSGRVPAVFVRNFGGRGRETDGMALWWPIVDICVEIDFTLSQAGRGLKYSADPTLFVRRGIVDLSEGLYDRPAGGMAQLTGDRGERVSGVTQTLVGEGKDADAKLLEINADGIKEERAYASDLREYALEVIGGMRSRAGDQSGPTTGRAIDKTLKPLRRLVRRQRRPYGRGLLIALADLTLYGFERGIFESPEIDLNKIPAQIRYVPEWPTEDTLQGQDLLAHAEGLQLIAGGSNSSPVQLLDPAAVGAKAAGDMGFHEPFESIKGNMQHAPVPGAPASGISRP